MANMFPVIAPEISAQPAEEIGRAPVFDADIGQFILEDGALQECSGRMAVQQWFDLMLRQQIERVPIYHTDGVQKIGIDRSVLGKRFPSGLAVAEIERNVRETASFCPAVRAIRDFSAKRIGNTCVINFTAVLHSGESVEVKTDVR